jgi:hypothetical protein
MTPEKFVDELGLHFSMRHDDDSLAAKWLTQMIEGVRGYPEWARAQAFATLIKTRAQRSFPLLSELRKTIEDQLPPPTLGPSGLKFPSHRAPATEAELERNRSAAAWQKEMADKYGTFENYLTATVNIRSDGPRGARLASKKSSFKSLSNVSKRITGESE